MFQIDSADAVGSKPAKAVVGPNPLGHFRKNDGAGTRGTVVTADWLNMINSELAGLLAAASPAVTQSKTLDNQVEAALRAWPEIGGLLSSTTDTGVGSTGHTRVSVAGDGRAVGGSSFCAADLGSESRGTQSATMATQACRVTIGGTNAAIIAARADALGELDNVGDASLIAASTAGPSFTAIIGNTADACAILATKNGLRVIGGGVGGCAMLAVTSGEFSGTAQTGAIIASGHESGGSVGSRPDIEGEHDAVVGVDGKVVVQGDNVVVLASSMGSGGATITDDNIAVMFAGSTETIRLASQTGRATFQLLSLDNLPTSDPSVVGQVYRTGGALMISI